MTEDAESNNDDSKVLLNAGVRCLSIDPSLVLTSRVRSVELALPLSAACNRLLFIIFFEFNSHHRLELTMLLLFLSLSSTSELLLSLLLLSLLMPPASSEVVLWASLYGGSGGELEGTWRMMVAGRGG